MIILMKGHNAYCLTYKNTHLQICCDSILVFFYVWYGKKLILSRVTNYCFVRLHIYVNIVSITILKQKKIYFYIYTYGLNVNMVKVEKNNKSEIQRKVIESFWIMFISVRFSGVIKPFLFISFWYNPQKTFPKGIH